MKKQKKGQRGRKRSAVKDLSARKASAVKGGLSLLTGGVGGVSAPIDGIKFSPIVSPTVSPTISSPWKW